MTDVNSSSMAKYYASKIGELSEVSWSMRKVMGARWMVALTHCIYIYFLS